MSDGITDCAEHTRARAVCHARTMWPEITIVWRKSHIPEHGKCVYIHEEHMRQTVELIEDGRVLETCAIVPNGGAL